MRINPCHGCSRRHGCEQREVFRQRVLGIGARTVTFHCPILTAEIRPGRRVVIPAKFVVEHDTGPWETAVQIENAKATIRSVYPGHYFTSVIDADAFDADEWAFFTEHASNPENIRNRRKMHHNRIVEFLDEPDHPTCKRGELTTGGVCDWRRSGGVCACSPGTDGSF